MNRADPHALDRALLQLVSWPPLTRLPAEDDPEVLGRVCALLSCKPTVRFLVPRVLGLPPPRVATALELLHQRGHLRVLGGDACPGAVVRAGPEGANVPEPVAPGSPLGKLWRHLVGRWVAR
jgi:hypothetical protein